MLVPLTDLQHEVVTKTVEELCKLKNIKSHPAFTHSEDRIYYPFSGDNFGFAMVLVQWKNDELVLYLCSLEPEMRLELTEIPFSKKSERGFTNDN